MHATMQPDHDVCVRSDVRIISVQPDRDHAFVDVIGECSPDGVGELRQRVDGLLIAGARFVLVDLSEAGEVAPSMSSALAPAARQFSRRNGWLRMVGHDPSASVARYQASLSDLFTIYQSAVRKDVGRVGQWAPR